MEQYLTHLEPFADVRNKIMDEIQMGTKFNSGGMIVTMATSSSLVQISGKRLVKFGGFVAMAEAAAMEFIRQNTTTIPVPKVHFAFFHDECGYIVMDLIEAETLSNTQIPLSDDQLMDVANQLQKIVATLREIGGKATVMGSWPYGPFRNPHFRNPSPSREFRTMDEFRQYWLMRNPKGDSDAPELDLSDAFNEQIVLTHGDLSTRNILIKIGVIVAVLDWETLGWYPSFWEYTFSEREAWYRRWAKALASALGPITRIGIYYAYVIEEAINPQL